MLLCELQAGTVAVREEFIFVMLTSAPDGADSMEDPPGMQSEAWSSLGISGVAPVEFAAGSEKLGTGCPVNSAIDTTAAEQRGVGCIDDGVNSLCCDVSLYRDEFCHLRTSGLTVHKGLWMAV